ncbi:MAG TPA: signal peptidase I [Myxococcales bacterium]|mgnify:CR=1 FL=1|nr:signal peptidase I [Myxococcales bacterium]
MAQQASKKADPNQARAARKKLKKTRREAKDFLREAKRLTKRYGKRLQAEKLTQLQAGIAALENALPVANVEKLGGALKHLDQLVEKHLGFARRSPAVEFTVSISKALAIALVLRLFVIEAFKIPSGSMIPTLMIGDHIFVNKLSYSLRLPVVNKSLFHWGGYERGDIVVFVNPLDDERPFLQRRDYIKRIVGLPGDTVEVKGEVIYVNGVPQPREIAEQEFGYYDRLGDDGPWVEQEGELLKEKLLGPDGKVASVHDVIRDPGRPHLIYEGPFKVPEGHLFMMGDNRDNSQDGRAGGWYVPLGHVKGRALVVWLSWGKPGFWLWDDVGFRFERFFTAVR